MTYEQYRSRHQDDFNKLPIFWAFGREQFEKALAERGIKPEEASERVVSVGSGGLCLKEDVPIIKAWMNQPDELAELMKDYTFAEDAIYYEMCNHEYAINWQRNWDVLNCFAASELEYYEDDMGEAEAIAAYMDDLGWNEDTRRAFMDARRRYMRDASENEWF